MYLITIHKSLKTTITTEEEILSVLDYLSHYVNIIHKELEAHGLYKQLHAHAMVETSKYFKYSKFTKFGGYQIHWKKIKQNPTNVIEYINKNRNKHCSALQIYKTHYFNQSTQNFEPLML